MRFWIFELEDSESSRPRDYEVLHIIGHFLCIAQVRSNIRARDYLDGLTVNGDLLLNTFVVNIFSVYFSALHFVLFWVIAQNL